jgi:hypothetical protein
LGIRLTEAPESRRDDPRARTTVVDHVKPGTTFSRGFEATNGTDAPMPVRYYVRPARLTGGAFSIDDQGTGEIQQWTTVTPADAVVPAGGAVQATLRVAVPASATAGEYYGAVIVEKPAPTTGSGARIATRAAVAIYLSVGPGGEPASDFTVTTLTPGRDAVGKPMLKASVNNTGGRALSISGNLKLSEGPGGLAAGPFPAEIGTVIGVGQSAPVAVVFDEALPNGPWKAKLDLQSGLIKRSATGTFTFPDKGEAAPVNADLVEDADGPPWPLIAAAAAGLLLLVLLRFFLKRRRPRDEENHSAVTVGPPA